MTSSLPVALAGPPAERPQPRVTVAHRRGCVNTGDGRPFRFVVRYVVDGRTKLVVDASTAAAAARRGAAVVRAHRPRAVWLVDETTGSGRFGFVADAWRMLARAADNVRAAFVEWTASADGVGA
ncbi:hypothetical protein [Halobacterium noricense]|uniref:hypothetical protein n=1 Tax=Halobacterium noricense TaxID=223182 RepID=UPI001E29F011|nr:hypothetical protein [Halobacterium noricense]UHH24591.1 hypothetical protein LT974_11425 [Halobacterium noricense]